MIRRALVALLAVVLTGCGVQPSGVITGIGPPSGPAEPDTRITLYLVAPDGLTPVRRPGGPIFLTDTLALLAKGPTEEERAAGLTTAVPPTAAPFSVTGTRSGTVVITPSAAELSTVAVSQIVCTVAVIASPAEITVVSGGQEVGAPSSCPV